MNIQISKLINNNGQIEGLPKNPRIIKDYRFEKLKKSIQDDPEMLTLRECIVMPYDKKYIVICGNMRLKACIDLGYKEVPCKILDIDTPVEKLRAYTIKDNVGFGDDDHDLLANEWDIEELKDFGLELPTFDDVDYSDKNKEIDTNEFEDEMIIKLKYTEIEYNQVKDALSKVSSTPEDAVFKLLKLKRENYEQPQF